MINIILAISLLSAPARAADAPAAGPIAAPSVALLKDRFIEAEGAPERTKILNQIAKTVPVSGQDVANLFDLFSRFTDDFTRKSVMASLSRLGPGSPQLEPMFITYLRQPEPDVRRGGREVVDFRPRPLRPTVTRHTAEGRDDEPDRAEQ